MAGPHREREREGAKPGLTAVLLIDEIEVWGGTETHLLRLLPKLAAKGCRTLLAPIGGHRLAGAFRERGIPVAPLDIYRVFALSGLLGIGRIAALLRRWRADLLVTYHTAADLLGPVAARIAAVPVISCRRDEGFTKKPVHVGVQRLLNPLLEGMIVVSHAVARAVERQEGYDSGRVQVIWNGEELADFGPGHSPARAQLSLPASALLLTCVSSLTPVKDHATLLRAFGRLAAAHPDAHLLIVGDGPLKLSLQTLAKQMAPRQVHFLGHRDDVPDLLRASDIYVQSSSTEGFSNSILQGMASALPVVATAVGGNPELVPPECGTLVRAGDAEELSAALDCLIRDADLRRRMGQASRRRVERAGSIETMVQAYADAFERAARRRFAGPSSAAVSPYGLTVGGGSATERLGRT